MSSVKDLVKDLWKAGHKKEARALFVMARNSISAKEMSLQLRIFDRVLSSLGVKEPGLQADPKAGTISFYITDVGIVEFPRFLERLLMRLHDEGTREYSLDKVVRDDPMKVVIRL